MTEKDASLRLEHCSPRQLAELLALAERAESGNLVRAALAPGFDGLLAATELPGLGSAARLVERLVAETTSLETHVAVKRAVKTALRAETSTEKRDVLTYVYHVAVAAALAMHGAVITSRSLEERLDLYEGLAEARAGRPARLFLEAVRRIEGGEGRGLGSAPVT